MNVSMSTSISSFQGSEQHPQRIGCFRDSRQALPAPTGCIQNASAPITLLGQQPPFCALLWGHDALQEVRPLQFPRQADGTIEKQLFPPDESFEAVEGRGQLTARNFIIVQKISPSYSTVQKQPEVVGKLSTFDHN
jgi:hypothetical protein